MDNIKFMSKPESVARAKRLLPLKGSEDARPLLIRPPLPTGTYHDRDSQDITPDPAVDWIIDVELSPGREVTGKQVLDVLDGEFRTCAEVYGYESAEKRWAVVWNSAPPEARKGLRMWSANSSTRASRAASIRPCGCFDTGARSSNVCVPSFGHSRFKRACGADPATRR